MLQDPSLYNLENIIEEHLSKKAADKVLYKTVRSQSVKTFWKWIVSIGVVFVLAAFCYFAKQIHKLEKKQKEASHVLKKLKRGMIIKTPILAGMPVPMPLRNVPFAATIIP
jgi:hypothetical protein